ncbi:MAG: hypothetical protein U1F10_00435 [Burkholderiales bacterium]
MIALAFYTEVRRQQVRRWARQIGLLVVEVAPGRFEISGPTISQPLVTDRDTADIRLLCEVLSFGGENQCAIEHYGLTYPWRKPGYWAFATGLK